MKYIFIQLAIQDGEREHTHRIVHTTNAKNLAFAVERYASTYWGYSELDKSSKCWYAFGGEISIKVENWKELTQEEYKLINKLFY